MGRQRNRDSSATPTNIRFGLSAGDAWNQKVLQDKYLRDLEARSKDAVIKKKKPKKTEKVLATSATKRRISRDSIDFRCKTRPNTASSERKPPLSERRQSERRNFTERKNIDEGDETERFFDIIRDTVTDVVQKKLGEIVGHHFQNVLLRIDEMSQKLRNTENNLNTLCDEMNNKMNHYGEEHSRHFRYICMKLEYDKIFYQHMYGYLRPEHLANGMYSCGQNLAQDLVNIATPCQLQACPCTSRATARTPSAGCDTTSSNLDNRPNRGGQSSKSQQVRSEGDKISQSRRNFASGDTVILDDFSIPENLKPNDASNFGNSEIGLKEILASIKQYYPNQEIQEGKTKSNKTNRKSSELDGNGVGIDDQSSEVSSQAASEEYEQTTPDIMNVKVQHFKRQF